MRRIHKVIAVCGTSALLTLTLTPAALAAGSLKAGAARAGVRVSGATYKGKTSQKQPFKMVVSGKTIKLLEFGWIASCTKAGKNALKDGTAFKNVPIKNGKFGGTFAYTESLNNGQLIGKVSGALAGKVNSSKTTGAFSITDKIFNKSGKQLDTCKTGNQSWSAHKA